MTTRRLPWLALAKVMVSLAVAAFGLMVGVQAWSVRPALAQSGAFSEPAVWHAYFCVGGEICGVGDVNGDGKDDLVTFLRSSVAGDAAGDVYVALSDGRAFGDAQWWHGSFCYGDEVCAVGDVNGDGMADLLAFVRSAKTDDGMGDVWVALSTGAGFGEGQRWHGDFCVGDEVCAVGDVNGDGMADLITFLRSSVEGDAAGDVYTALSTGSSFGEGQWWHGAFCFGEEVCRVGDVNGDGMADLLAFVRSSKADDGAGDVWVALSTGGGFGEGQRWHGSFCYGDEVCAVGDVNGDRMADILAFVRSTRADDSAGDVWVALSDGRTFGDGALWHGSFCYGDEVCAVGDVNGDGADDILAFVRSTRSSDGEGDVWAALAPTSALALSGLRVEAVEIGRSVEVVEPVEIVEPIEVVEPVEVVEPAEIIGPLVVVEPVASARPVIARGFAEVTAVGDNVRVRVAPGLGADVLTQLRAGTVLQILEGPVSADGYTWWHIRTNDHAVDGWAVEGAEEGRYLLGRHTAPDEMPGDNFQHR